MSIQLKVILPAAMIPDGSQVTKVTGTRVYTLKKSIEIYGMNRETIYHKGNVFLCAESINMIPELTELLWSVDSSVLAYLIEQMEEETPQ